MNDNSAHRKSHKRIAGIVAALCLIAVLAGAGLWYANRLLDTSVPAIVTQAENTLQNSQSVLLGHANVRQMARLEQVALDGHDEDVRYDPDGEGLTNDLLEQGIDWRQQLQQLVFSLNVDPALGSYLSAVLATTADPQAIRRYLEAHYELEAEERDGLEVLTFRKLNRDLCRYSEARAAILDDGLLVISHPDKVAALYHALTTADAGTAVNQQWADYRSQRLLSLGIFEPEHMSEQPLPGITSLLLMGLRNEWGSMESLFAGAKGTLIPPALSVDFTVNSRDSQWVADSRAAVRKRLDELDTDEGDFFTLLLSKVSVEGDAHSIGSSFTVDGELVDAGKRAFKEGIGNLVSGIGGNAGTGEERIDESPQVYLPALAAADLPAFENETNEMFQWSQGPLAARLNSVGINRDGLTTLEITVATAEMPNAPGSHFGSTGELRVTEVLDAAGNSLLQVETCGTDLNQDSAEFGFMSRASKRVRLKPGTSLADVEAVHAQVTLRVAAGTRTEHLPLPLGTDRFEQDDSYLRIKGAQGGQVDFVLGGPEGGFLNLRALNAAGKYLESAGSTSFGNSYSRRFHGEIHSLELVRALSYHEKQYAIQIETTAPPHKEGGFAPEAGALTAYDLSDWPEVIRLAGEQVYEAGNSWLGEPVATARSGPAELVLFKPEVDHWGEEHRLSASMQLNMPYVKALEAVHGRAQLHLKEVKLRNEPVLAPDRVLPLRLTFSGFGNNYKDNNKSEHDLRRDIYLNSDLSLRLPVPAPAAVTAPDERSLESLHGELAFLLPTAVDSVEMSPLRLGEVFESEDFALQVIGLASDSLSLRLLGDSSRLLALRLLDAESKLLGDHIEFHEESRRNGIKPNALKEEAEPAPRTVGTLKFYGGRPAKLEVVTATGTSSQRYPFELVIGKQ